MTADHLCPDESRLTAGVLPIVEVRTYRTERGRRDEFIELFKSRGGPAQREYGMTVLGPLPDAEDGDTLVWLRAFRNADERESVKAAFYEGPEWTEELQGLLLPLLVETSARVCYLPAGFLDGPLRSPSWH